MTSDIAEHESITPNLIGHSILLIDSRLINTPRPLDELCLKARVSTILIEQNKRFVRFALDLEWKIEIGFLKALG